MFLEAPHYSFLSISSGNHSNPDRDSVLNKVRKEIYLDLNNELCNWNWIGNKQNSENCWLNG